ncbi:uncharacterized protein LOC130444510 isoform X1 [Diorhabda sublineata]|uniref:uncharacterized protein LOC130444510 isoform X1 n=1 Tax=Diorhabda sublineata TaxID=1163346 RepID=UPI0024E0AFD1|nr:uncharacterized protein LOC130444510 isoform X1 [Diorhabda sublineata]XP_056635635.1 uncharacterized protein LOC130444510 isoform X1 [Diorhabda sublineata]
MFRPEVGLHQGVVQELVESVESGDIRSVQNLLDAGWRLEASQAIYTYLTRLVDPLIPAEIQALVLEKVLLNFIFTDENGDVPVEVVAADVLGLIRQELPGNHLQLIAMLLHLLDFVIKSSPADELRGNTLPISMLPIFFNIQNQHINEWRRIAAIFLEIIRQSTNYLDVTLYDEEEQGCDD